MSDAILSTTEYGNPTGTPVVALHGGRCTREYWLRTATEGIPRRRWICPDLRGHGRVTHTGSATIA
ncbi:alpha/beta fold hydrolase [Phytohabitans kaempferiae]|uniref:Alpha/beta fold hydrolase n=1 Tax=Phytohabitans kaempferiae TaxID=1620943 RepID=A0ABV6MHK8_9ACTN